MAFLEEAYRHAPPRHLPRRRTTAERTGQQGWISPVVLAGGYVVGVWDYKVRQARLAVTVEPFEPLSRAIRDGIEQEAARLGVYFNAEPEVRFAD